MLPALRVLSEPPPSAARNNSGVQLAAPFVGLAPYTESDARLFFGRDRDLKACLDRLERDRLMVLVGDHGSGRTSLVRAGIPAAARTRLSSSAMGELSVLHLDLVTTAHAPFDALLEQLERWGELELETPDSDTEGTPQRVSNGHLRALVTGSDSGLCEAAARLGGGQRPLLVVVDGLEELALGVERTDRVAADASAGQKLLSLLVTAAARRETLIYVVLTTTPQGLSWAQAQLEDRELLSQCAWYLRTPSKADLVKIINGPAALNGVEPNAALTQRIVADLKQVRTPLGRLSHALQRTWDAWRQQDGQRSQAPEVADYESIGGVQRAFEQHAEALFDAQSKDEREATGIVLPRLLRQQAGAHSPTGVASESAGSSSLEGPIVRELQYDSALDAALRSASIQDPRACFERALMPWQQMGLVVSVGARQMPAASNANLRVRLTLTEAAQAWPRLGLWVHAERGQQAQYRRWLRLAECNSAPDSQLLLQGDLLRQAALFWNQYCAAPEAIAKHDAKDDAPEADPVGRMVHASESFAKRQEETQGALARARNDRRQADALASKARRRRNVSLVALAVVSLAFCGLAANRWRLGAQYDALRQSSRDTSEQKRALDEQHTQVRLENQRQGQQIAQLTSDKQLLEATLTGSEAERARQHLQLTGLEAEKAELEKNVGMLRRHSIKQDELITAKTSALNALQGEHQLSSNELRSQSALAAELAQSKAALGVQLSQCQTQKAEAVRDADAARAGLERQRALSETQAAALQRCTQITTRAVD